MKEPTGNPTGKQSSKRVKKEEKRRRHQQTRVARNSDSRNPTPGSGNQTQGVNALPVFGATVRSLPSTPEKVCSTRPVQKNLKTLPRVTARFSQSTKQRKSGDLSHTQRTFANSPEKLVGPSPIVPVQSEGVYTKALLNTGAQVTLLYRDFYDKHLSHIPIRSLEELEI